MTLESKEAYYGVRKTDSVFHYASGIVLVDGGRVLLARPDGTIMQVGDIDELLDPKEALTVEYAADDALIVRLYESQMLALINLRTKKGVLDEVINYYSFCTSILTFYE